MKKYLFSILGAALLSALPLSAQLPSTLSADRIVFDIKPGAKGVKLNVRMSSDASSTRLWHGEGDGYLTIENSALSDDNGVFVTYEFTSVLDKPRQIAVETQNVITIKSSSYSATEHVVAGVAELASSSLKNLFMVNNEMEAGSRLDLSKAVALEEIKANFTGVEEVILPKGNMLKRVSVSPAFLEKTFLKKINISDAIGLEELSISKHGMDTIDVSKNPRLTTLHVSHSKHKNSLRAILGIKNLTQLKQFHGEGNRLGFDQLPDMVGSKDEFKYGAQKSIEIASERIKGLTVDLSHLYEHRGINGSVSNTYQKTKFEWETVVLTTNAQGKSIYKKEEVIAPELYKEEGGIFTFDESLLKDGERKIRVKLSSLAYPGVGALSTRTKTYSDNLWSLIFSITTPKAEDPNGLGVETLEAGKAVAYASAGALYFMPEVYGEIARVYSITGQLVAKTVAGAAPLRLSKGVYVVQVSGSTAKVLVD